MIVSIGIDLIEIERVREVLGRTPRFRLRVFTDGERAYCEARGAAAAQHYAARFAAKEAAMKALGTGWSGGVGWHDAEVGSHETGAPFLLLHGRARELFDAAGATRAHLTLSHTTRYAIAQVIFESVENP